MGYEIVTATVEIVGCKDMVAVTDYVFKRIADCRSTACHCKAGNAPFENSYAVFQNALCGICKTTIYVSGIAQPEAVRCVLRITENVGSGLIDRNRTGIRCGIRLFLTDVQLESLEVEFVCCHNRCEF